MFILDTETARAVAAAYQESGGSLEAAIGVLQAAYRGLHDAAARQTAAAILGLPCEPGGRGEALPQPDDPPDDPPPACQSGAQVLPFRCAGKAVPTAGS